MDWDDARYFLAIAREGQMLAAARKLAVSQALLSRRMANFEATTGARLLDRSTRGCSLTEEGRIMFGMAERMEADILTAMAEVQGRGGVSGTVRIGAPDGFGSAFLAPRLHRLIEMYPDLHLQLVPAPRSFSLSQREADIAVMIGQPDRGKLRTHRLSDYSLGLYASQAYLDRVGIPQSISSLSDHRLVGYVEDLVHTRELDYTSELLHGWRSKIEIATAIGQLEAVRGGAGIGLLHDFMASSCSDLVHLLPRHGIRRTYWTAWHEDLRGARRVMIVAEFLRDIVRENQAMFLR